MHRINILLQKILIFVKLYEIEAFSLSLFKTKLLCICKRNGLKCTYEKINDFNKNL